MVTLSAEEPKNMGFIEKNALWSRLAASKQSEPKVNILKDSTAGFLENI